MATPPGFVQDHAALIVAAEIVVGLVVTVYVFAGKHRHEPRFFTYAQRDLVGRAFGANCIWRPVHWLPAAAAYVVLGPQPGTRGTVGLALVILAGIGLPITRTSGRCGGTIQGGHQRSHHEGGSASILNCHPECAVHNNDKLTTGSWVWAAIQWPWTLVVWLPRHFSGTSILLWWLATDNRARQKAQKGYR